MQDPHIEILGVHRLAVTEELLEEQFEILYRYEMLPSQRRLAMRQCKSQLEAVVLIEVLIKDRDERFQLSDFSQPQEGVPADSWQAPWAEAYLAFDGESLLLERWGSPPQDDTFRCAFFLHDYQPDKPLITSYGNLNCPAVTDMPERLDRLVPFEPVD